MLFLFLLKIRKPRLRKFRWHSQLFMAAKLQSWYLKRKCLFLLYCIVFYRGYHLFVCLHTPAPVYSCSLLLVAALIFFWWSTVPASLLFLPLSTQTILSTLGSSRSDFPSSSKGRNRARLCTVLSWEQCLFMNDFIIHGRLFRINLAQFWVGRLNFWGGEFAFFSLVLHLRYCEVGVVIAIFFLTMAQLPGDREKLSPNDLTWFLILAYLMLNLWPGITYINQEIYLLLKFKLLLDFYVICNRS